MRHGGTVPELARLVHEDFATGLKFARMWGKNVVHDQQVVSDHLVTDGGLVEHF